MSTVILPSGTEVKDVPEGISQPQLKELLLNSGQATDADFAGSIERGVIGAGAGLTQFGQGVKQTALGVGEKLGVVDEGSTAAFTKEAKAEQDFFASTSVGKSTAGKVGKVAGEVVPSLAIPGGFQGSVGSKILTGALSNSFAELLRFTDDPELFSGELARNFVGGATIGAAVPATLAGLGGGGKFIGETINELTPAGAKRQIRNLVGKEDIAGKVKDTAEDLDIFVTPAEASGRADLVALENGLTVSEVGTFGGKIAGRLTERNQKITQTLEDTIDSVARVDPASAEKIAKGYSDLTALNISNKFRNTVAKDSILLKEWNKMQRNPEFAADIATMPPESAGQLDIFKQWLFKRAKDKVGKNRNKGAKVLDEFRVRMVEDLDVLVPSYGEARALAQLNIVNKSMKKTIAESKSAVRNVDGLAEVDPIQFFRKSMKSQKDFDNLLGGLASVPEAQVKLTQLRTILSALEKTNINTVFTGQAERAAVRGTSGAGKGGAVAFTGFDFLRGKNSDAVIDYITDPKYSSELLESVTPGLIKRNAGAVTQFLGKTLARIAAQTVTPEAEAQ